MLSGLYYKHIVIVNDDSRVIRIMLQVVASPMISILMSDAPSCDITYDYHLMSDVPSCGITYDHHTDVSIEHL
jgi:hypothetical protein